MITVVVVDTSRVDLARVEMSDSLSASLCGACGSPRERERTGAYMALSECYQRIFREAMPPISYDEYGKPHISGGVAISLSHRDGVAAVAFADKDENLDTPHGIGVDIEWVMDKTRAEHIHARYTSSLRLAPTGSMLSERQEVVYLAAALDEYGRLDRYGEALCCEMVVLYGQGLIKLSDDETLFREGEGRSSDDEILSKEIEGEPSPEAVTLRWTALEATLKASGGGFRDLAHIGDILPMSALNSLVGSIGEKKYALSVSAYHGE